MGAGERGMALGFQERGLGNKVIALQYLSPSRGSGVRVVLSAPVVRLWQVGLARANTMTH